MSGRVQEMQKDTDVRQEAGVARLVERFLVCPRCRGRLTAQDDKFYCQTDACTFVGLIVDGVVIATDLPSNSFFDQQHRVMQHGSDKEGVRRLCYAQQAAILEQQLPSSGVILDVGCGPKLPYGRGSDQLVIGVDPSFESLRQNPDLDLRVFAYAGKLPLADQSVDAVVSLYAIHHFGGQNLQENAQLVEAGTREFARVTKLGGHIYIFELEPWWLVWRIQIMFWNLLRKIAPGFDILFWRESSLARVAVPWLGRGFAFASETFRTSPLTTFAPVFSIPALQIPRMFFPFRIKLYHWSRRKLV
jgi:ubiquinone/menaquinone biosynthesis C-methylase UbiE